MRHGLSAAVGVVFSLSVSAFAAEEASTVRLEVSGEAAIVGGDELKAVEDAVKVALRAAVEQVAGVMVKSESVSVNSVMARDYISARSAGYVKQYDVVSKKKDRSVMTVVVNAAVIKAAVEKDLEAVRAVVERAGTPSLVILIQEQTLEVIGEKQGAVISTEHAATLLTDAFKKDGWDVKDPGFVNGKVKLAPGVTLGAAEVKEIADISKVKFVLHGTVVVRNQASTMTITNAAGKEEQVHFPVTGEFNLALFSTETGSQIAKVGGKLRQPDKANHINLSYERTAFHAVGLSKSEIIEAVRTGVVEYLRDQQTNGHSLQVTVTGLADFAASDDFAKSLEAVKAVSAVRVGDFAAGKGQFVVSYVGNAKDFARALKGVTFKKKKVSVDAVKESSLELTLAK